MIKISKLFKVNKNNSNIPLKTVVNFENLPSSSKKIDSLKTFDTALIAYYMMGFGNFEDFN